jgi:hypothetical protein
VERLFTLEEARALLPEVKRVAAAVIDVRAQLVERIGALQRGDRSQLPEVKALEARLSEELEWFAQSGIQVKGHAPLLVDFPSQHDDRVVLLCWLENEPGLDWYHETDHGFAGRRRIEDLGA